MTYDKANRLMTAGDSGGWARTFNYDVIGNMWVTQANGLQAIPGITPVSNVFDPATNRIAGITYDNAGNA